MERVQFTSLHSLTFRQMMDDQNRRSDEGKEATQNVGRFKLRVRQDAPAQPSDESFGQSEDFSRRNILRGPYAYEGVKTTDLSTRLDCYTLYIPKQLVDKHVISTGSPSQNCKELRTALGIFNKDAHHFRTRDGHRVLIAGEGTYDPHDKVSIDVIHLIPAIDKGKAGELGTFQMICS